MRLDEGTSFPSAMAIAATGDPKLAYTVGKTIALEARAAGVHWIFAPDADVNNNPDNPIINVRSFGENPQERRRICHAIHSRRRGKRRARHRQTFSRPRQRQRGLASRAGRRSRRSRRTQRHRTRSLPRRHRRRRRFDHARPSCRAGARTRREHSRHSLAQYSHRPSSRRNEISRPDRHRRHGHGRRHVALRAGRSRGALPSKREPTFC